MKNIEKEIAPKFEDYIFDWYYETYLLVGGYGSGKSYNTAFKIVVKCLTEVRKVLVVREVYDTIKESCFDLFREILSELGLLAGETYNRLERKTKVVMKQGPMEFKFPNGSRIIFKGMDSPDKVKSINGVSIVWLEEATEVKYAGYKELLGRLRTDKSSMHFILTCNPVGKENWVYRHFFKRVKDDGREITILDDEELYEKRTLVRNGVYYDHSLPDDNPYLPIAYLKRLDEIKSYDEPLWRVARLGRFGANGTRVLSQLLIATNAELFKKEVTALGPENQYFGFDFGFEESYNAVISMSVDLKHSILYIFDEVYKNHMTDDKFAKLPEMQKLKDKLNDLNSLGISKMIVADNEDPKAVAYYRQVGFRIRSCRNKFAGSRLSNTRKIKRFKKIIVSPKCKNTIRELKDLTYKKDAKGNIIYDDFSIDPHTFSAIWYGLDTVTVADVKERRFHSKKG